MFRSLNLVLWNGIIDDYFILKRKMTQLPEKRKKKGQFSPVSLALFSYYITGELQIFMHLCYIL